MADTDLLDQLTRHRALGGAPREELAWLAAHGSLRRLNAGDVLITKNQPVDNMWVVLSGRIGIFVDRGTGPHKMMEWREGDVTGLLPYSRLKNPPGDTIAQESSVILAVHRDRLREMIRECHELTSI